MAAGNLDQTYAAASAAWLDPSRWRERQQEAGDRIPPAWLRASRNKWLPPALASLAPETPGTSSAGLK